MAYKSPDKIVYDSATGTTFKEAFADARKDGQKTFKWNGKSYGTKLAGEDQGKYKEDATTKAGIAAGKASEGRTRARPEDYEKDEYKKGRFENKMNRSIGRTTDPENAEKIKKYNETRKKDAEERAAMAKSSNKAKEPPETEDGVLPALGATGAALTAAAFARLNSKRKEVASERAATERANRAKSGTSLRAPGSSMDLNDPYAMMLGSEFDAKAMMRKNKSRMPGDDTEYKKGGKVKKMAGGGTTTTAPKPAPKKDNTPIPAWLQNERKNQEQDRLNRREREEYDKGEKTRLRDQGGFKKGGVTRGDGIAMRGKTKGRMR